MKRKHLAALFVLISIGTISLLLAIRQSSPAAAPSETQIAATSIAPAATEVVTLTVKPLNPPGLDLPEPEQDDHEAKPAEDEDQGFSLPIGPAGPLPPDLPTILLTDRPIHPSPLTGGVWNLPYVPPSPDTKPEFEIKPAPKTDTDGGNNTAPEVPALVLGNMPTVTLSFDALNFTTNGAGHPPDTNGDVGLNHYMESVNTSIGIYTKTTGARAASFTFNAFWSGAGTGTACDSSNGGDPIVLYDASGQRWIFMDFAWTDIVNGPYYFCFGVSQTSNPLGNYWRYAIRADDAGHPWLPDYPKGGVWPDGLYFSANMFDCLTAGCGSASYKEARVYAFNLQKMEAGSALTVNDVQAKDTSATYFSLMPSNVRGTQPPANTPNYFVTEDQFASDWDIFKFHVDFTIPVNSTFTGPTQVSQANYTTAASSVPEPSPGTNSDSLADRVMFLSQYRTIGGEATLSTSSLGVGSHPITATYGGDPNFNGSGGKLTPNETVNKADATTTVVSSQNPVNMGQVVTFTATLAAVAPGSGIPTGVVTFTIDGSTAGTATLSSGAAIFATSALTIGSHPITVTYGSDANFTASNGQLIPDQVVVGLMIYLPLVLADF